ncbi:unnamed protein product [Phytomonas sp. EM1]|nr:unnamed protein product [Phytomonas sp. EM1]|eukprot:CCW64340.1 unnamed protein product [Phytomonas sp. isolate EM1]
MHPSNVSSPKTLHGDNKPRLIRCPPDRQANVLIASGFSWYVSEVMIHRYLRQIFPEAEPTTTRLYDDPVNGASRGHCFIEYPTPTGGGGGLDGGTHTRPSPASASPTTPSPSLALVKQRIEATPFEHTFLTVSLYYLTNPRWDRGGRLPDLPTDPPPLRREEQMGYGDEGFVVRCGPFLGLPNTISEEGKAQLSALRKRMRKEKYSSELPRSRSISSLISSSDSSSSSEDSETGRLEFISV